MIEKYSITGRISQSRKLEELFLNFKSGFSGSKSDSDRYFSIISCLLALSSGLTFSLESKTSHLNWNTMNIVSKTSNDTVENSADISIEENTESCSIDYLNYSFSDSDSESVCSSESNIESSEFIPQSESGCDVKRSFDSNPEVELLKNITGITFLIEYQAFRFRLEFKSCKHDNANQIIQQESRI